MHVLWMPRSTFVSAICFAALSACSVAAREGTEGASSPAQAQSPAEPAAARTEAAASPSSSAEILIIAKDEGLFEYDLDGKQLRQRSSTSGEHPRVLPDGNVLLLATGTHDYVITQIDPQGKTSELARVLRGYDLDTCKAVGAGDEWGLEVQEAWGFRVDADAKLACLSIADRNFNMADIQLDVRVDLSTSEVQTRVVFAAEEGCVGQGPTFECKASLASRMRAGKGVTGGAFAWRWDPSAFLVYPADAPEPAAHPQAWRMCPPDVDLDDEDAREALCGYEEGRSSGGRFVAVHGPMSEGDYIHRTIFVIDLDSGELLGAGTEGSGDALKVMTSEQAFAQEWEGFDAVGESDLRWVGEPGRERLWLDGRLIDPEARRVIRVGGQLAHRAG